MTQDQLVLLAFTLKCNPLLYLIRKDKIKRIHELIDKQVLHIELYHNTFADINFNNFLNEISLSNLDISMKIIGKQIHMFIRLPK